jgi:hypothetical protein
MEACYGGTDVMERPCAVARGIDINSNGYVLHCVTALAAGQSHWFYLLRWVINHMINSTVPVPPTHQAGNDNRI